MFKEKRRIYGADKVENRWENSMLEKKSFRDEKWSTDRCLFLNDGPA